MCIKFYLFFMGCELILYFFFFINSVNSVDKNDEDQDTIFKNLGEWRDEEKKCKFSLFI